MEEQLVRFVGAYVAINSGIASIYYCEIKVHVKNAGFNIVILKHVDLNYFDSYLR